MTNEELLSKAEQLSAQHKNREVIPVNLADGEYAFMFKPDFHTQLKIIDSLRAGNSAVVCDSALENLVIQTESSKLAMVKEPAKYRIALGRVLMSMVETTDAEIIKKN